MNVRPRLLTLSLAILFVAGCSSYGPSQKSAGWEIRPVTTVRHGLPTGQTPLERLARHHLERGHLAAAEAAYAELLAAEPRHADAWNALGRIHAQRGRLDEAIAAFRRAVALVPERASFHNNLGHALQLAGRLQEAVTALRQAVMLDPTYTLAWANLQQAAAQAGERELVQLAGERKASLLSGNAGSLAEADRTTLPPGAASHFEAPVFAPEKDAVFSAHAGILLRDVPFERISETVGGRTTSAVLPAPTFDTPESMQRLASSATSRSAGEAWKRSFRLEISNGNGVGRLATRFSQSLHQQGLRVTRITNFEHFRVERTTLRYPPQWRAEAERLRSELNLAVVMEEIELKRYGADLRLILGRDAKTVLARLDSSENSAETSRLVLALNEQ